MNSLLGTCNPFHVSTLNWMLRKWIINTSIKGKKVICSDLRTACKTPRLETTWNHYFWWIYYFFSEMTTLNLKMSVMQCSIHEYGKIHRTEYSWRISVIYMSRLIIVVTVYVPTEFVESISFWIDGGIISTVILMKKREGNYEQQHIWYVRYSSICCMPRSLCQDLCANRSIYMRLYVVNFQDSQDWTVALKFYICVKLTEIQLCCIYLHV